MRRADRRDVLETTAGIVATGALAGLAGCLSDAPATETPSNAETPDGDETAAPTATPTEVPRPGFVDWLPAPGVVSDSDHYGVGVLEPAALAAHAGTLGREYYDELVSVDGVLETAGLDPESVETHVASPQASVLDASFDGDDAADALENAGGEHTGSHGEFDVWTGGDDSDRAIAVGDGTVVVGRERDGSTATAAAEAAIDARAGTVERYGAAVGAASGLFSRLADGQIRTGVTRDPPEETDAGRGQFAGNSGLGYRVSVDDGETTVDLVLVFESEDDADAGAVQQWIDGANLGGAVQYMDDVAVEADGTAVVVSGRMDTADLSRTNLASFFVSRGVERNVQAGASAQVDSDEDVIEVRWTSNQNADHLTARFQPDGDDAVEERIDEVGGSVTYEGSDGETVQVTVLGHADDQSTVIMDKTAEL